MTTDFNPSNHPQDNEPNAKPALAEPGMLLRYIKQNPDNRQLVEQAQEKAPRPESRISKCGMEVRDLFIANPDEFHGTAYVTLELRQQAKITARMTTLSSLLDFVGNQPLFLFAFAGVPLSWLWAFALNLGLLKLTNDCSAVTSGKKFLNRNWSKVGMSGFIFLSLVKSIVSPVGVELLNNKSQLAQLRARELIVAQGQNLDELKNLSNSRHDVAQKACEKSMQELAQMGRNHPLWESTYVRTHGQWNQTNNKDWSGYQPEQIPICHRPAALQAQDSQAYEAAKKEWQAVLAARVGRNSLSDLAFIRENIPALYRETFDEQGELRSGVDAVRLASLNLFAKLLRGDLAGTGFSLFFMLISLSTSATACALSITLARRPDQQRSRSDVIIHARDQWLEDCWQELVRQNQAELAQLEQDLLATESETP
jgi:hypothetical protein